MTLADPDRKQRLRWRSLSGNLIDRRGAALAPPILLAVGLNVAAVTGLAYIAGFHAVYASLIRIQWARLCAVPAALAVSAVGYYFAYRSIYAAENGYALPRGQLTAVVAAGFGGLFSTGGIRPDALVLRASGASRREALVRVTALGGMEQAILALYGCAAAIAGLCLGLPGVPVDFTLPWAVIPVPAFAVAFWLASRCRARLQGLPGWRARLSVFLDAVLLIQALFTRRIAPLAGAGTLTLILPLTIWASGAPLATAIAGVAACRLLGAVVAVRAGQPAGAARSIRQATDVTTETGTNVCKNSVLWLFSGSMTRLMTLFSVPESVHGALEPSDRVVWGRRM